MKDWGAGLRVGLSAAWGSTRRKKVARILNQIHSSSWVFAPLVGPVSNSKHNVVHGFSHRHSGSGERRWLVYAVVPDLVAPFAAVVAVISPGVAPFGCGVFYAVARRVGLIAGESQAGAQGIQHELSHFHRSRLRSLWRRGPRRARRSRAGVSTTAAVSASKPPATHVVSPGV